MSPKPFSINISQVNRLIDQQFPQWKNLNIKPVILSGWDNKTFHLGDKMLIRMPSAQIYSAQIEKESLWLPIISPKLPLQIPCPLAIGQPGEGYPCKWSIYQWIEGKPASHTNIDNLVKFSNDLASFLLALYQVDTTKAPKAGHHNFYRGASLSHYDKDVREALKVLGKKINTTKATNIWERALRSSWKTPPVWVHGDISLGNLIVEKNKLIAVIDWGQMATGDPSCDLAIAWTFFEGKSFATFQEVLNLDPDTWDRAQGWALWKALITAAQFVNPNNVESKRCWHIINRITS
ncbi:MAG: hypothetical protein S4CHLAM7_01430 [Chlamydiae bacterium]|nr:hypothetical protein [Chlamydiota bacterium]